VVTVVVAGGAWVIRDRVLGDGWTRDSLGNSQGLVTDGEAVCATTTVATLYCVDASDGSTIFTVDHDDHLATPPTLAGDTLLVGVHRSVGTLRAYSTDDGEQLWRAPIDTQAHDEIAVVGDTVVAVDGNIEPELVAVDLATGEERWRRFTTHDTANPQLDGGGVRTDGHQLYVSVTVDGGTGDIQEQPGFVVALDPATGNEIWRTPIADPVAPTLGIDSMAPIDDTTLTAFVVHAAGVNGLGEMLVVDTATGQRRWQAALGSDYSGVAHLDGTTVLADGDHTRGYSSDGTQRWAVPSPETARNPRQPSPGNLVVEDGQLWILGYDVHQLDPTDGTTELTTDGVSATDIAVIDDHLIIAGISQLEALPLPDPIDTTT
jgi:outer membrane protein assembly factor BamB